MIIWGVRLVVCVLGGRHVGCLTNPSDYQSVCVWSVFLSVNNQALFSQALVSDSNRPPTTGSGANLPTWSYLEALGTSLPQPSSPSGHLGRTISVRAFVRLAEHLEC